MVILSCNDTFTLKTEEFRKAAHDLALHIAATDPKAIDVKRLPPKERNNALADFADQLKGLSEPDKLNKYDELNRLINSRLCLADQPYVKDTSKTVAEWLGGVATQLGEKITIEKFVRWEIDES